MYARQTGFSVSANASQQQCQAVHLGASQGTRHEETQTSQSTTQVPSGRIAENAANMRGATTEIQHVLGARYDHVAGNLQNLEVQLRKDQGELRGHEDALDSVSDDQYDAEKTRRYLEKRIARAKERVLQDQKQISALESRLDALRSEWISVNEQPNRLKVTLTDMANQQELRLKQMAAVHSATETASNRAHQAHLNEWTLAMREKELQKELEISNIEAQTERMKIRNAFQVKATEEDAKTERYRLEAQAHQKVAQLNYEIAQSHQKTQMYISDQNVSMARVRAETDRYITDIQSRTQLGIAGMQTWAQCDVARIQADSNDRRAALNYASQVARANENRTLKLTYGDKGRIQTLEAKGYSFNSNAFNSNAFNSAILNSDALRGNTAEYNANGRALPASHQRDIDSVYALTEED